ncbi:MAG TPA: hypothetical protein VFI86_09545, partial [Burkholderiales bacterium]|nr:hypothetical protein [Burkholderiales bacterium]
MKEIADSYRDVWGREKRIDPAVRRALERSLGPARGRAKVALKRGRCHEPGLLARGGSAWGFMV